MTKPSFRRGSPGPAVPQPVFPARVTSAEARQVRNEWHHAFNNPRVDPLVNVRCARCPGHRLVGEVRRIDGVLVLGLRSPDRVYEHFEILVVGGSASDVPSGAEDDPAGIDLCPEHPAAVRAAQRRLVAARAASGQNSTIRI